MPEDQSESAKHQGQFGSEAGRRFRGFVKRLKPAGRTSTSAFGEIIKESGFTPLAGELLEEEGLNNYPISLKDRRPDFTREDKRLVEQRLNERLNNEEFGASDFHETLIDLALLGESRGGGEYIHFNGVDDEVNKLNYTFGQKKVDGKTISLLRAAPLERDPYDNDVPPREEKIRWKDEEDPALKAEFRDAKGRSRYDSPLLKGKPVNFTVERRNGSLYWVRANIQEQDIRNVCESVRNAIIASTQDASSTQQSS